MDGGSWVVSADAYLFIAYHRPAYHRPSSPIPAYHRPSSPTLKE
ncbi:hypothetical protein [Prevotella denticola]|nr:hypothetical protein [Prevotella denticola]